MTQPGQGTGHSRAQAAALIASARLAGDVVLLGSLVQTQWVQPGDAIRITNHPLGEVAADFTVS